MNVYDQIINRQATESVKWETHPSNVIPMDLADMDIPVFDEIVKAIKERAQHPIYGYTTREEAYNQLISQWLNRRHHYLTSQEDIYMTTGVLYSLNAAIQICTNIGDHIIVPTPAYRPFITKVTEAGRQVLYTDMKEVDGRYLIDFDALEKKIDHRVKALIFCSPHNPSGTVYTSKELEDVVNFCLKHQLYLFADEIHADFIKPGTKFTPIQNINDYSKNHTISMLSITKSFNLAGLKVSYVVIKNNELMSQFKDYGHMVGVEGINTFGLVALKAAYTHGDEWIDGVCKYIHSNKEYANKRLSEAFKDYKAIDSEGTYLIWLDFSFLNYPNLFNSILEKGCVALTPGTFFGQQYENYLRLNVACSRKQLVQALDQIIESIKKEINNKSDFL